MVTKRILVEGKVQGVGFRHHTQQQAQQLGLDGWVRNLSDGRVEVLVRGDRMIVDRLITWLNRGPSSAQVKAVVIHEVVEPTHLDSGFFIKHGGGA